MFALGEPFGVWGAVALDDPRGEDVAALLDRGAAGISLPAAAFATEAGARHVAPAPGRARGARPAAARPPRRGARAARPALPWWPACVGYVAELHAAWHGFAAWARPAHETLRVVFVALAGAAPLHVERSAARGGPALAAFDPLTFYETSSYGPRAIEAVGGVVGVDQLVHGSDRPVVGNPPVHRLGPAGDHALTSANPSRLLAGEPAALEVPA